MKIVDGETIKRLEEKICKVEEALNTEEIKSEIQAKIEGHETLMDGFALQLQREKEEIF